MAVSIKKDFSSTRRSSKPDTSLLFGKLPPQAPELEMAVLGAIMLEREKLGFVMENIQSPDCFYVDAHQKIYAAIRRLVEKGSNVDILTVPEELKKTNDLELVGGAYYVTTLTSNIITAAHVETHVRIIMEKFIQRELIRISGEVINDAYEDSSDVFDLLDKAESGLYEITDKHLRKNFKSLSDVLADTLEEIQAAKDNKEDVTGVPTGFRNLDMVTAGWQKDTLIVIAARPGVGKTAFCLNLAMNAALHKTKPTPVAFFSLEMGAGELAKRMLSATTDVSMDAITKGRMQEHEFVQLTQRMSVLTEAPIYLDDQAALNIFELRAKARRLKQHHDVGMIIIDYLQLMQGDVNKGGNREQEISKISRDLKALAKELSIPIIALSQLNRGVEGRKESKVPMLSDLRESGAIEQDADMVIFLYRPEYHGQHNDEMGESIEGETHIVIAKNRSGTNETLKTRFIKEYQRFEELNDNAFSRGADPKPYKPGSAGVAAGGIPSRGDNPQAGLKGRDASEFGGSKVFIPGGFQTMQSKASDYTEDDDDMPGSKPAGGNTENDTPF